MKKIMGLCEGRHELPVSDYIYEKDFFNQYNMFDFKQMRHQCYVKLQGVTELHLYVTGYTPALTSVIEFCEYNLISLTLYHFNHDSQTYEKQIMSCDVNYGLLKEAGYCK